MLRSDEIRSTLIEIQRLVFEHEFEGVNNAKKIAELKKKIDYYNLGLDEEEMAATEVEDLDGVLKPKTD